MLGFVGVDYLTDHLFKMPKGELVHSGVVSFLLNLGRIYTLN